MIRAQVSSTSVDLKARRTRVIGRLTVTLVPPCCPRQRVSQSLPGSSLTRQPLAVAARAYEDFGRREPALLVPVMGFIQRHPWKRTKSVSAVCSTASWSIARVAIWASLTRFPAVPRVSRSSRVCRRWSGPGLSTCTGGCSSAGTAFGCPELPWLASG